MIGLDIKNIMDKITPLWGICSFDKIKTGLIECRAKGRLPKNAKSVIVACFPYLLDDAMYADRNISRYAVVTDYHSVALDRLESAAKCLKSLYPEHEFAAFSDNSPIPEVKAACLAGLGAKGKNSLLITQKYGSFVFIGEIVTSLELSFGSYAEQPCIGCGKCIQACPVSALAENGFKRSACISEITQKKGELSPDEEKLMKECGCVWGCDICQEVCPMNQNAAVTEIEEFLSSPIAHIETGCSLDGRAYEWRGRKVIERNIAVHGQ